MLVNETITCEFLRLEFKKSCKSSRSFGRVFNYFEFSQAN